MIKAIAKVLIATLLILVLIIGFYILYVVIQYNRINDNLVLTNEINNNQSDIVNIDEEYSITTYNIGFGAYSREFTFFLDSGEMLDGKKVVGTSGTAFSEEEVIFNTNGASGIISSLNPDFMFFQEVDVKATRSYHVNQFEMLKTKFIKYASVMALNFDSAYLFYPLNDPHGKTKAGITTFSKYKLEEVTRYQLPIDPAFPTRFFDLDRCFMVSRIKVNNGKELVLINIHMSAYDEGGIIRLKQLEVLNKMLEEENKLGNYIVVGGDFNHDIANSIGKFETKQKTPAWVSILTKEQLTSGYKFASSDEYGTCRSSDIPYIKGVNYEVVIDGFIVSDNVSIIEVRNIVNTNDIDVSYLYSDHNPVYLKFKLS